MKELIIFSQRLKFLRTKNKFSIKEVAQRIGVSESTYREWEYGRQIRGHEPYLKIAKAFGISLDELFGNNISPSTLADDFEEIEKLLKQVKEKTLGIKKVD